MNIGYRRWSLSMGFSQNEQYVKAGWFEKRIAFIETLKKRGHHVVLLSNPSRVNPKAWDVEKNKQEKINLFFVELSAPNLLFQYDTIKMTVEMIVKFQDLGVPVIFLWDDPEMKLKISNATEKSSFKNLSLHLKNCIVWANALGEKEELSKAFYYPHGFEIENFTIEFAPFFALLDYPEHASTFTKPKAIYLGNKSGGRKKILKRITSETTDIITEKEETPKQNERKKFYSQYLFNLGISDKVHKQLKWFTGRMFHALAAGIPSVVEEGNFLSSHFSVFAPDEIPGLLARMVDPIFREAEFQKNLSIVEENKLIINKLFAKYGI